MKIDKNSTEYQEGFKDGIIFMGLKIAEHTKFLVKSYHFVDKLRSDLNEVDKVEK